MLHLLLLTLVLHVGTAWSALAGRQEELKDLRGRIAQLRDEVEKADEDRKEASDNLRDSERRISSVNRTLRELQKDERQVHETLRDLAARGREIAGQLRAQEGRLEELLRQRYVSGDADPFRLLISGRNPADISRDLEYYAYIGRARADLIRAHRQNLDRLAAIRSETDRQRAELGDLKRQRLVQRQALDQEKRARQSIHDKLAAQIRKQRREIDTLVRDEARLTRLVDKLRRATSVPKKDKQKAQTGARNKPERVERVADATLAGLSFAALRGKLALPVAGEILGRFGQAREGGGPAWKGLFISAKSGQEVRAVASGEVVFAEWLRGFGNLLILDHGGGYLSLYSNNESLYKQAGESVRAGDVLAAVGNTGGQEAAGLYFELRRQGQPFDPMTWVK